MMISFIKATKRSKPTWKKWLPPLYKSWMNWDEPHFWESWVQFHSPHRGLITARPVESRTHFNRTCLTKWSRLKDQKQMRNKVIGMYQSGKGYKPFLRLWDFSAAVRAIKWRRFGTVVNLPRVAGRPKLLHLWMAKKPKWRFWSGRVKVRT